MSTGLVQLRRSSASPTEAAADVRPAAWAAAGLRRDLRLPDERGRQRADAGGVAGRGLRAHRRSGGGRPDPAEHLRRAGEGGGAGVRAGGDAVGAEGGPAGRDPGDHRLHGRAPEGEDPAARALRRSGDRSRRLPAVARAPVARAGRRARARHGAGPVRDLRGAGPGAGAGGRAVHRRDRPRHHPARLRQVLHVLRGALHAGARAGDVAARGAAADAGAGRRRRARGATARADGELLSIRGRRLRGVAAGGGGGRGAAPGALHLALSPRFLARGHPGHRRVPDGVQARAPAAADGQRSGAGADAPGVRLRHVPPAGGRPARGGAGHRHHHRHPDRLLRRDRAGVRRDAAGDGRDPLRQRLHVRLQRARGHLRRPQDARHRARGGEAAPAGRGDRRPAPGVRGDQRRPGRAGARRC